MNWIPFLKKAGAVGLAIAPEVLSTFNPLAGAVLTQVLKAEVSIPGKGKGPEKKALVLESLPMIIPFMEAMTGRDLVDDAKFTEAVGSLVDAIVAVLKSVNNLQEGAA